MEIDDIISLMVKYTFSDDIDGELGEQDAEATPTTSTGGGPTAGYPTVTKWETGLTRSVANTIDDKVTWKSLNKLARGKANTLL
jgi:hypothetical protein